MPNALKFGDFGPDVTLLQDRLNARPSGLPLLAVDGCFGEQTLERVKEFQTSEFVDGIVAASVWDRLLAPAPDAGATLFTEGRHLFDSTGKQAILRGVNKMSVYDFDDPTGAAYFPEIRRSGANSVRIVWKTMDDIGVATDLNRLDALITNARQSGLVPMVELHDATGNWDGLGYLVDYWVRPALVALIRKHQAYLLVNIGNEVGDEHVSATDFITGYMAAVTAMRAAGIRTPLVIDAPDWGKNLAVLNASAAALLAADPARNLLFSVHAYWPTSCGGSAQFIRSQLQEAVALEYPLIVGEFSKYGGFPCNDPQASICGPDGEIDYQTILQVCHENGIGWYAWEWGPGNALGSPPDSLCAAMDMTPDGQFDHLKPGWAQEVAVSSPFSLANTSLPIVDGLAAAPATGAHMTTRAVPLAPTIAYR
jgi:mannan endo-1,4-beta-mannosidase